MNKFSLHEPLLKGKELSYVKQCLDTGWLSSSGNFVNKFEKKLKDFTGHNVICCNTGTSALHVCLILAGTEKNNEVIVPSISFIATVNVVLYCGASPIFIDCDESLCTDLNKIINFLVNNTYSSSKFTYNKKTKKKISAIIITNVFGNLTSLKKLKKLCKQKKIKLIEDAAESLGSFYSSPNKHSGLIGDYGALSFNVNKIITTGAGGAIFYKKKSEMVKIKRLISQGKTDNLFFKHKFLGYNYGMPNTNAAIGLAQIENIEKILSKKKKINLFYQNFFSKKKNMKMLTIKTAQEQNNWLNIIKFENISYKNFKKNINILISKGIDVRPLWYPCHKQLFLKKYETYKIELSNKVYKNHLCLPSSYFLKKNQLKLISQKILNVFKQK